MLFIVDIKNDCAIMSNGSEIPLDRIVGSIRKGHAVVKDRKIFRSLQIEVSCPTCGER